MMSGMPPFASHHPPWMSALLVVFACDASGPERSGVAGHKQIRALSVEELRATCRWRAEHTYASPLADECRPRAVFTTTTSAECRAEFDECIVRLESAREPRYRGALAKCETLEMTPREDCSATVAQFEDCVLDSLDAVGAHARSLTCEHPNPDVSGKYEEPPSCGNLNDWCWP